MSLRPTASGPVVKSGRSQGQGLLLPDKRQAASWSALFRRLIDAGAQPMFDDGLLQNIGEQNMLLLLLQGVGARGGKKDGRAMPTCRAQCPQKILSGLYRKVVTGKQDGCRRNRGLSQGRSD